MHNLPRINASDESLADYCKASGLLFYAFARMETGLAASLRGYISLSLSPTAIQETREAIELAAAIIGSLRFAALRDLYKRILTTRDPSPAFVNHVETLFNHAGEIAFLRDRLAHQHTSQAVDPYDSRWINNDIFTTRKVFDTKPILFSTDDLWNAANDCAKVLPMLEDALIHPAPEDQAATLPHPSFSYKTSALVRGGPEILAALRV